MERLYVCVINSASELVNKSRTISISLEDIKWPHKVKARLEAFKSFEEPLYEELALKQLPDKSLPPGIPRWFKMAKNKRSTESVRSSSKAVRKFEAPQHNESASKKMPDLSR
ncbi:uncharacterized protein LOC128221438 [Mya arenaria]|uniref:uncharacterized protein LOC128221438 n=1 Tax=Mya arenaria TaxID=6604 RepID=UPI0022E57564|nr:uncharacterized protein LOC128221438 [Mya arenaria]